MAPQGLTDALGILLERDATRAAFLTIQWQHCEINEDAKPPAWRCWCRT
jgi:hypothetical protein